MEGSPLVVFQGGQMAKIVDLISSIKTWELIRKGCMAYVVMVKDLNQSILDLDKVPVA